MPFLPSILKHFTRRQIILLLSLVVGLGAALAAQALKWLIGSIEHLLTSEFSAFHSNWLYLVYPAVGILLCSLFIKFVVRDDISHGVTKILYALSRKQAQIRTHNTWSSVIASALTIGFGGSVGAESPIVLTGSAIGSWVGRYFRLDHHNMMLLVGCGASAAIAGIFKAPIAGVVFTLEVLMIDLTMSSLLPLMISALTATCFTYALTGTDAMFVFDLLDPFRVERVPAALLLGLLCGLLSLYFTRVMNRFERVFAGLKSRPAVKFMLGAVVLALLIFIFPPLYGEGYTTINLILNTQGDVLSSSLLAGSMFADQSQSVLLFLGLILVVKVFATTATNGGGGCGGTFAPSLFLGCILGALFAQVWNLYEPFGVHIPLTNFALMGMAGVMSGVFHAPLTGVFLIAELTGGYQLFLPIMIVSATAYLTIHAFEPHSIYSMRLARKGELLTHHKDRSVLTLMSLDAVIDKTRPLLRPEMLLGDVVQTVSESKSLHFAVVNPKGELLGQINLNSIRNIIFRSELYHVWRAEQIMQQPDVLLRTSDPMTTIMEKFSQTDAGTLPVLTPENVFVGYVSRTRLFAHYREVLRDFSEE